MAQTDEHVLRQDDFAFPVKAVLTKFALVPN